MLRRISIAELQRTGVTIHPEEAVAIAQQLISCSGGGRPSPAPAHPPYGLPSPANTYLESDGRVTCGTFETTPAVSEVAIFLQSILPFETGRISGSLRYTIARALLDVEAPPFDSLDEFSGALARHERGDRVEVIRKLLHRAGVFNLSGKSASTAPIVDRRRMAPGFAELRRQLRDADARVYEQQRALDTIGAMQTNSGRSGGRRLAVAAGIAIGLTLVGAGELMQRDSQSPQPPTAASTAAVPLTPIPVPATFSTDRADGSKGMRVLVSGKDRAASVSEIRKPTSSQRNSSFSVASKPKPRNRSQGMLDRLHMSWLRGRIVIRHDTL
jgi:hypothetical protein